MESNNAKLECTINNNSDIYSACQIYKPITLGLVADESKCVWTCEQIKYYCARQFWYDHIINTGYPVTHPLQYQLYHVGCVCNLLLFLTLLNRTLNGTTFMFLRVISFVQFCLGAMYYFHPGPDPDYHHPNWIYYLTWPRVMKDLIQAGRFMLNILSAFMTAERLLAVVFPLKYSKINVNKFVFASILLSFLISLIEMGSIFIYKFRPIVNLPIELMNGSGYGYERDEVGAYIYANYIGYIVIAIKVALMIFLIVSSALITTTLFTRGRQVSKMMSSQSAVREYKDMLALCRFQMADMAVMMIDILATILMGLQFVIEVPGITRGHYCTFDENLFAVNTYLAGWIIDVTKDQFLSLEHGELFFIYLIFFGRFRSAFVDNCKMAIRTCRKLCRRGNAVETIAIRNAA